MTGLTAVAPSTQSTPQAAPLVSNSSSSDLSFKNVFDTINPLQHIPILSNLYRAATGSSISTGAQIAGDTAYGMLLGGGAVLAIASSVGSAAADAASIQVTGKTVDQNIVSAVSSPSSHPNAPLLVPDQGQAAIINAQADAQSHTTKFFHLDKHPTTASALYEQAAIEGSFEQKLVHMVS